jgi:DNA-binding PadR family transcriptional regulator
MTIESELVRQHADLLVLSVLADGAQYGYAISKEVASRSDSRIRLTPGVLYPLLHKLEKQKLLLASWDEVRAETSDVDGGRKRKWYRLSAKGRRKLEQRIVSHRATQNLIETFIPDARAGGSEAAT